MRRTILGFSLLLAACDGVLGDTSESQISPTTPGGKGDPNAPGTPSDGSLNNHETDVDCGGPNAPKCAVGKQCLVDSDCTVACDYRHVCVDTRSCKRHLGGDTCGTGEVGDPSAAHESCCKTLPVAGYSDPTHPGQTVYVDKYEITTGRVRAFLETVGPNIRGWLTQNRPTIWDDDWSKFLPADVDHETIMIDKNLLGDPRGTWPGAPPPPPEDQPRHTGTDYAFNGEIFVYLHGHNCVTLPDTYGFPTFFYPLSTLQKMDPSFPPRADGTDDFGKLLPASEHLEVKAMNCITNALLAAFCAWDGGQLATDEVLDFITDSPSDLGNRPGCGTQIGTENPPSTAASQTGGRCPDLDSINATYDAGDSLPQKDSPLNKHNYWFPYFPDSTTSDKAWEVSAPGRGSTKANGAQTDVVRINPNDEPWVDLAGNLNESVLVTKSGTFTGKFGLKYRGIGYESARSTLNFDPKWDTGAGKARIERPEAKAAFAGGRCMRFK